MVTYAKGQATEGVELMFTLSAKSILLITSLSAIMFVSNALAVNPEENSEIENLKRRIENLEGQQAQQQHETGFGKISELLTLHGLLEVEASYTNPDGGDEESDLTLATAELSLEATLNDYIGGQLTLLYEEEDGEDDDVDVDVALIRLDSPGRLYGLSPSLQAGRMYVPFGMFNSHMISDPLTLDLGETQNTAAVIALEGELWNMLFSAFNGNVDTDGEKNTIDSWVVSLNFTLNESLLFGLSYMNDLAESDIELVQNDAPYGDNVGAASAYATVNYGDFILEIEYVGALEDFDEDTIVLSESDLTGPRPEAWNLELSWTPIDRWQFAGRYEQANDFQDDVSRYGGTVSYGLYDHMVLAFEYLYADAKLDENDPIHLATAQLALEF